MSKLYFAILCWLENIKAAIHCWRCGYSLKGVGVRCECTDLREALYLLDAGLTPAGVDYRTDGGEDTFWFKRTAALLKELADYRRMIRKAVGAVDYENLTKVCDIPGSQISPIDDQALDNTIAPRGHIREAFVYGVWPETMRRAYVEAAPAERRRMIDSAYSKR